MKGKIYRLSNGDKHYYGSTTKDLKERLSRHLYNNNNNLPCSSKILYDSVEYKISIDLMEEIEYENKDDLLLLERWWIENNYCVNERIPIRTRQERLEKSKEHNERIKNDEELNNKKKEYYKSKDYSKYQTKYREVNREVIRKQQTERRKVKRKEEFICECGVKVGKECVARHRRTKKHIKLMENKTENIKITITGEQQRHERAG